MSCRLASLRLRDSRCRSAQEGQRAWPGMLVLLQLLHKPSALAFSLFSRAKLRRYSMRSGRWFLIRSYSRRPCFGGLGFLGLSVGGSFAALGLVVGGFLRAALVFFGPVPTFLGSGKVCWKVILLGESAGHR